MMMIMCVISHCGAKIGIILIDSLLADDFLFVMILQEHKNEHSLLVSAALKFRHLKSGPVIHPE